MKKLIYNVMLVSGVQKSDSVISIYIDIHKIEFSYVFKLYISIYIYAFSYIHIDI